MSDKINELAEKAGWINENQFSIWHKLNQYQNFNKEKFAELIIQECINAIDDYDIIMHNGTPQEEVVHAIGTIRGSIKEKFGVK